MAKSLKEHLEDTFNDLTEKQFKSFKNKLGDRKKGAGIRKAALEKIEDAIDLADLIVSTFTPDGSVPVVIEILEAAGCNAEAAELKVKTGQAPNVSLPGPGTPQVPLPGPGAPSAEQFIDKHRMELIKRVSNVDDILDELLQMKIITDSVYDAIRSERTSQTKMRELFSGPIKSAGAKGKQALYKVLKEVESCLIEELEGQ